MGLWQEFVAFKKRESEEKEENVVQNYLKDFDFMDDLNDHIWSLSNFVEQQYQKKYGKDKTLWFLYRIDESGKYNEIRVTKSFQIDDKCFDIEVNLLNIKWGLVADSPEDFDKVIEDFLKETKENLDLLNEKLPQS